MLSEKFDLNLEDASKAKKSVASQPDLPVDVKVGLYQHARKKLEWAIKDLDREIAALIGKKG